MKIAFHNFLTTLRRYKVSSLLNVIGLTLAFTAFYVILVQVRWELTFNRDIPDAGRICLVAPRSWFDETGYSICSPRPDGEQLIARSPEIEAGGCLRPWGWKQPLWIGRDGNLLRFDERFHEVSQGFIETMGLRAAVVFCPMCTALFFPGRVDRRWALAAIIAGPVAVLLGNLAGLPFDPLFIGMLVSFVLVLLGAAAQGRQPRSV